MCVDTRSTKPTEQRCPIARASLAVTSVLYDHFEVDKSDVEDAKSYLIMDSSSNLDRLFKPLLLHWTRLHVAGLYAFFRLWKITGAELDDFEKIAELVRILIESVVGGAPRTKDIQDVEEEMTDFEYRRLRDTPSDLPAWLKMKDAEIGDDDIDFGPIGTWVDPAVL